MDRFDIYFCGELLPETNAQTARERLGALFGMDERTLDTLFSGKPVRVKTKVDTDKADRYRAVFRKAGALITVVPHGATPPQPREREATPAAPETTTAPPPRPAPAPDLELLPPRTGSLADCAPSIQAVPIADIDWMHLDAPGVPLDERQLPPAPEFDLSGLSVSEPASFTLADCAVEKPRAELPDIGHLSLTAEAGEPTAED